MTGNGQAGLRIAGASKFVVEHVLVERNGTFGMDAQDGATGSISDSSFNGNADNGVFVHTSSNTATMAVSATRSRIHGNAGHGLRVDAGQPGSTVKLLAADNVVSSNTLNGVIAFGLSGGTLLSTVRGNSLAHNVASGALSTQGASMNIADNVAAGNASFGFRQSVGAVLNSIGDNVAQDNSPGATSGVVTPITGD
jgi:hypothetical protein